MMTSRCLWSDNDPLYISYHDLEWGVPEHNDESLYEKLMLDGFQAGLSWITILKKRENFREAFNNFHPECIAGYGDKEISSLMQNKGIIRNRNKIECAIKSARAFLTMRDAGDSFDSFIWSFTNGESIQNRWQKMEDIPTETLESVAMSKALKSKGFSYCGPTICYAFMQAIGMVNDHLITCFRYKQLKS